MSEREFELYLSLMRKLLRLGPEQTAAISDELRDHFDERFAALCRQGVPREEAIRQALDEFGDAAGLATDFTQLARTRRRRLIMRCTLATVVLGAAALFIVSALTPPNAVFDGPPQAQAEADAPAETLDIPAPEPATSVDPAKFVPAPLAKKLTWEFTDLPLSQMLAELSKRVEMPIVIDERALMDSGIPTDEPVSDRLHDQPAYLLLDRMASPLELIWYVDDGIVLMTSQKMAENHLTLRSHVFTDLREAGYEPDVLISLIQNVTSGPWEDIDGIGGTLTRVGDVLFVRQTDQMHREVDGLLEALRHHGRETYAMSSPVHESIREKLKEPSSWEFVDMPLQGAVALLSQETGIVIWIDEVALADVGMATDEPINFVMQNKPLETVLKYLLRPLELTAIPDLGRLLITTTKEAENTLQVVLHDVSDVCHSKEETEQLSQAVLNETKGPWLDIDGIGGVINVPVSGIMVVRQTEDQLQEVRELLAAYRKAVDLSGSAAAIASEMEKVETRYYRMNANTARDLQTVLPKYVRPGTWWPFGMSAQPVTDKTADGDMGMAFGLGGMGMGGISTDWVGEISTVAIDSKIETLPGRAVSDKQQEKKAAEGEEPTDNNQPDVLVIPQAVLIIKHTKAAHRDIERFLKKVQDGDSFGGGKVKGFPGMGFSGFPIPGDTGSGSGGGGGGFFRIEPPSD